jgi:hypothetical protein
VTEEEELNVDDIEKQENEDLAEELAEAIATQPGGLPFASLRDMLDEMSLPPLLFEWSAPARPERTVRLALTVVDVDSGKTLAEVHAMGDTSVVRDSGVAALEAL